jgi:hypothetical protein
MLRGKGAEEKVVKINGADNILVVQMAYQADSYRRNAPWV